MGIFSGSSDKRAAETQMQIARMNLEAQRERDARQSLIDEQRRQEQLKKEADMESSRLKEIADKQAAEDKIKLEKTEQDRTRVQTTGMPGGIGDEFYKKSLAALAQGGIPGLSVKTNQMAEDAVQKRKRQFSIPQNVLANTSGFNKYGGT